MLHAFNPRTWEAEAGGSLWVQGQPGLHSEFQDSPRNTEKPYLEKQQQPKNRFDFLIGHEKQSLYFPPHLRKIYTNSFVEGWLSSLGSASGIGGLVSVDSCYRFSYWKDPASLSPCYSLVSTFPQFPLGEMSQPWGIQRLSRQVKRTSWACKLSEDINGNIKFRDILSFSLLQGTCMCVCVCVCGCVHIYMYIYIYVYVYIYIVYRVQRVTRPTYRETL